MLPPYCVGIRYSLGVTPTMRWKYLLKNEVNIYKVREKVNELYFTLLMLDEQIKLKADLQELLKTNEDILTTILLMGRYVLDVPLAGSIVWIFLVSAIYIILALSLIASFMATWAIGSYRKNH